MSQPKLFKRSFIRKVAEYVFIIVFSVTITFVVMNFTRKRNTSKYHIKTTKSFITELQKNDLAQLVVQETARAFNIYADNCPKSDEIQPKTKKCHNSFGFVATAVESLELLYILGLKNEFKKAKSIVMENLQISKLNWINRAEFWNRCIGGLIGAFQLTQDKDFIKLALNLADSLLSIQKTRYPMYVHLGKQASSNPDWLNTTVPISSIISGVPELLTLTKITGDEKFQNSALYTISQLAKLDSKINNFINYRTLSGNSDKNLYNFDKNLIDYYRILAISNLINPHEQIQLRLEALDKKIDSKYPSNIVFEIEHAKMLFAKNGFSLNFNGDSSVAKCDIFSHVSRNNPRNIVDFKFSSASLIYAAEKYPEKLEYIIMNMLNQTKLEDGYSGKIFTTKLRWIPSNIQNSDFFGDWMKFAAEQIVTNDIIQNSIRNINGHYLSV